MSSPPKKNAKGPKGAASAASAPVEDVVAHALFLREAATILRSATIEYAPKFAGSEFRLPELLLQRRGGGARPATIEAILEAVQALNGIAGDLEGRARELLGLRVEVGDLPGAEQRAPAFLGDEEVVHRDLVTPRLRPVLDGKSNAG